MLFFKFAIKQIAKIVIIKMASIKMVSKAALIPKMVNSHYI